MNKIFSLFLLSITFLVIGCNFGTETQTSSCGCAMVPNISSSDTSSSSEGISSSI